MRETEKKDVEQLKFLVKNPPVLALPCADDHLTADTYACCSQPGCVSLQNAQDGTMIPIRHWTMTLAEPKKKLAAT